MEKDKPISLAAPLWFALALSSIQCRTVPSTPAMAGTPTPSVRSAAWEAQFSKTEGWTGGDVARSVLLTDGRILWLFGDSWIGPVENGQHAAGSTMVSNALAISTHSEGTWSTEFYYGRTNDHATAWIRPSSEIEAKLRRPGGKLVYWPTGDAVVDNTRLYLFLDAVFIEDGGGTWGFESRGTVLATVTDTTGDPNSWSVSQAFVPWSAEQHDGARINWGIVTLSDGDLFAVFGRRTSGEKIDLVLARADRRALADFEAWRFWTGADWSTSMQDLDPLFENVTMEPTVTRSRDGEGSSWMWLESAPDLIPNVTVRFSDRPEGPWSCSVDLFEISSVRKTRGIFAAQAKLHSALSSAERTMVSWVVNAHDFWDIAKNADLYRPRFRELPNAMLAKARALAEHCEPVASH